MCNIVTISPGCATTDNGQGPAIARQKCSINKDDRRPIITLVQVEWIVRIDRQQRRHGRIVLSKLLQAFMPVISPPTVDRGADVSLKFPVRPVSRFCKLGNLGRVTATLQQ